VQIDVVAVTDEEAIVIAIEIAVIVIEIVIEIVAIVIDSQRLRVVVVTMKGRMVHAATKN
jgi:hypothetical protein